MEYVKVYLWILFSTLTLSKWKVARLPMALQKIERWDIAYCKDLEGGSV